MVPVGIVAVVSMNTIMKKNSAMTLTSSTPLQEEALGAQQAVREHVRRVRVGDADADAFVQHREPGTQRGVPAGGHRSVEPVAPAEARSRRPRTRSSPADRS